MKMHHVAIQVTNLDVAHNFYVELLGLPLVRQQDHALWVNAGDLIVMLELCPGPVVDDEWKAAAPGPFCLVFAVDPPGRLRIKQRLLEAGVAVDHESTFTTYVRDPFGCRLGFSHHPHPPDAVGGV